MASALASHGNALSSKVFGFANIQEAIKHSRKEGKRYRATSKYMPHQGEREIARRRRQQAALEAKR